jgi:hypothetical protein
MAGSSGLGDSFCAMLNYEYSRTEEIINRLIQVSNAASSMLIVLCCLAGIAFFGGLGVVLAGGANDGGVIAAVGFIGSVVGVIIGWQGAKFGTDIIISTAEWMAQSLIAQGETLEQLKKNSE